MEPMEVGKVNAYIKSVLDRDGLLSDLAVRGEVSNFKPNNITGNLYFSLKDSTGSLKCVMFSRASSSLRFEPKDGMQVTAWGKISVYQQGGVYQLYCTRMSPDGVGDLYQAFEQLKEKLWKEGLFNREHKKPLPTYPHRIAVVTSADGAAIRDILRILRTRYPLSRVYILPVRVQGNEASAEIAGAIRIANRWRCGDILITGRGGGSMEDLWAFNDERVARAIYASAIPVISAVGHEPDTTISDFVADVRASTPSNAAERAVPDKVELLQFLDSCQRRLEEALKKKISVEKTRLGRLASAGVLQSPDHYVQRRRADLKTHSERLNLGMRNLLTNERNRLSSKAGMLDAFGPLKILGRGYALVREKNGTVIRSASGAILGTSVSILLSDGSLEAVITGKTEENET